MDDIIATVAWQCGDKDCKQQWHKGSYWIYGGKKRATYSYDEFSDGDHETVEKRYLPTPEMEHQSWLKYSRFVLETGTDPLYEFIVKHTVKRDERWEFKVNRAITGVVLIAARHAGRGYSLRTLPEHVRQYMGLKDGQATLTDFKTWDEFAEAVPIAKPKVWFAQHIEHEVPRRKDVVTRELRAIARRHINREQAK